ncbi:MAG: hypothetical protein HQK52_20380 [Oligoflexia bacterium]|nr:hypothetical protein [Oligoflexia bacterium]
MKIIFYAIILFVFQDALVCHCQENDGDFTIKTHNKFSILSQKISQDSIDEEKIRIEKIINKLQAPYVSESGALVSREICEFSKKTLCNYCDFVQNLKQEIESLKDIHSSVCFSSFQGKILPVVASGGSILKNSFQGSPIFPIVNSKAISSYVYLVDTNGIIKVFKVLEINGKNINVLPSAITTNFIDTLLRKREDDKINNIELKLKEILTSQEIEIQASYNLCVGYGPKRSIMHAHMNPNFGRTLEFLSQYNCENILPNSDFNIGACISKSNHTYIWIRSWYENKQEEFLSKIKNFLELTDSSSPVFIDISGNKGGQTNLMIDFLCHFGNNSIIENMAKIEIRRFTIDNNIDSQEALDSLLTDVHIGSENKDLLDLNKFKGGIDYLKRYGLDINSCKNKLEEKYLNRRWVIITNGEEISTSEQFLYLVKKDLTGKFTIVGKKSQGATGNPISLDFPGVQASIRLSVARLYDNSNGMYVIEGQGVRPHVELDLDNSEYLENNLKKYFYGVDFPEIMLIPEIIKKAK